jgi:hypothetical protein
MLSRDDIIRMALVAGWNWPEVHTTSIEDRLERFFKLAYEAGAAAERTRACRIVTGLCISDNNAREINEAIRMQATDRLARHGISIPEDEEYGNPSFG